MQADLLYHRLAKYNVAWLLLKKKKTKVPAERPEPGSVGWEYRNADRMWPTGRMRKYDRDGDESLSRAEYAVAQQDDAFPLMPEAFEKVSGPEVVGRSRCRAALLLCHDSLQVMAMLTHHACALSIPTACLLPR